MKVSIANVSIADESMNFAIPASRHKPVSAATQFYWFLVAVLVWLGVLASAAMMLGQ